MTDDKSRVCATGTQLMTNLLRVIMELWFKQNYHSSHAINTNVCNERFPDWKEYPMNRGSRSKSYLGYIWFGQGQRDTGLGSLSFDHAALEHNITGRATQFQIRIRALRIIQLKWISKVQSVDRNQRTDAVQVPPSRTHSWKLFTYTLLTIIIPAAFVYRPMSYYTWKAINLMSIIKRREPLSSYATSRGSLDGLIL